MTRPAWPGNAETEWVFACWDVDGPRPFGFVAGYRLRRPVSWYWCGYVTPEVLLHATEWDVHPRADPMIVKSPELWAEHHEVAVDEQWTISNELYVSSLETADDALDRAYGIPTPMAADVEWYATAAPQAITDGLQQDGVAHGLIELVGGNHEFAEVPARRWSRTAVDGELPVLELPAARAHSGLRFPVRFPSGEVADWVLTPDGWRSR